ncbi:hypothetical protein C8F01DRAFT_117586 [Mycena amicta]|nr:hypothetical protein C8F01DRAFT_117586 [Mycena amicta]
MSPRTLYLAALALLALAVILGAMVAVSLPTFSAMDFVRVTWANSPKSDDVTREFRFGIWAPCQYSGTGKRECIVGGHGYSVILANLTDAKFVVLKAPWTRGLAIHPVSTLFVLIALIGSLINWTHGPLLSLIAALLSAFLLLICFFVDIALYAHIKGMVGTFSDGPSTSLGPAFWLAFISLLAVLGASGVIFMGGRKAEASDYPEFSGSGGKGGVFSFLKK